MPDTSLQRTREELARREVGHTNVGRWTAWVLAVQFILVVAGVPLIEILHDRWNPEAADNPVAVCHALCRRSCRRPEPKRRR
jgi:hypothetical protein